MTVAAIVTFVLVQQLQVVPSPSPVGAPAVIRTTRAGEPVAGALVRAEYPDGTTKVVGTTDAAGTVTFVPSLVGDHTIATEIEGVRVLAPHRVVAVGSRWPMAIACVPLGLAALWAMSRRRREPTQPSTRST